MPRPWHWKTAVFPSGAQLDLAYGKWIFQFDGYQLRGLEQNPETASRWAQLARQGKKVMQFLQQRRYVAVVVDGKVQFYGKPMLSID